MPRTFTDEVREFLSACLCLHSYNLFKNPYIWFGLLWGIPIPLVTTSLAMTAKGHLAPDISDIFQSPLQCFFLAHPLLFGALFGILGTIRQEKDTQIQNLVEELRELSTKDPLTGLANRRHFIHTFEEEVARTVRQNLPLSIIFLDLDFFKKINDTHGHLRGDTVLREVSRYMQQQCRPYDTAARWGGEEFVILLPADDETKAAACAERIRCGIAAGFSEEIPFPVTISAGVARYKAGDTLEKLTERADQALYRAKQTGRNRVVLWQKQDCGPCPAKDA
ncbi:MAG: GGDEF domain-containing protein [Proteobacteria bacterium]|nr:GGDEF domain-containing protein [Pseudomonadota bacterium]MBU4295493.1 GGDEF domain-containing protein [Pseudomonadota bacterium]MCG2749477.1 GGDEF domain-containing protein [Desulfobulbaceae bacterium]